MADHAIERVSGITPTYFRPPRGCYTKENHRTLDELGKTTVLWDIGLEKTAIKEPVTLVSHLLSRVGGRQELLLLFHDGNVDGNDRGATVKALPLLIEELIARGCIFMDPASDEGKAYLAKYAAENQRFR